jgi:hypothetical protein
MGLSQENNIVGQKDGFAHRRGRGQNVEPVSIKSLRATRLSCDRPRDIHTDVSPSWLFSYHNISSTNSRSDLLFIVFLYSTLVSIRDFGRHVETVVNAEKA